VTVGYGKSKLKNESDPFGGVNPAYLTLDGQARKKIGVLNRKIAEFGAVNLEGGIEPCEVEAFTQRKSDLQESIASLQKEIDERQAVRDALIGFMGKRLSPGERCPGTRRGGVEAPDTVRFDS